MDVDHPTEVFNLDGTNTKRENQCNTDEWGKFVKKRWNDCFPQMKVKSDNLSILRFKKRANVIKCEKNDEIDSSDSVS